MLRLVTFDVTNTLLRFRVPPGELYAKIAEQYGINANAIDVEKSFKKCFKNQCLIKPNFGAEDGGYVLWWSDVVKKTFAQINPDIHESDLQSLGFHLIKLYGSNVPYEIKDGAVDLLNSLVSKNINVGVISNFDSRLSNILKQTGLYHYFKFVVDSYSVKVEKPDPQIFSIALKKIAQVDVKPSEALHVGDNLILDYKSARDAGWSSVLISNKFLEQTKKHKIPFDSSSMFKTLPELSKNFPFL